jgi:hypothetical protein
MVQIVVHVETLSLWKQQKDEMSDDVYMVLTLQEPGATASLRLQPSTEVDG